MGALTVAERIAQKRGGVAASRSKGLRTYKFKSGKTKFRILPALDPNADFERKFGKSYLKTFDEKQFFAIGDRDVTYGQTDPIREMIFDAMRVAPTQDIKEHFQKCLAQPRYIFNALILDDKDQAPGDPVLIELSETGYDNVMAQFELYADADPTHDLASLDRGHVFQVEKTGEKLDTRYSFLATPQQAKLDPKILDKLIDMDAWITSQFEGLETKAIEFLGRLNGSCGISGVNPPALQISSTSSPTNNISAAAVTTIIEEEAEYVEVDESLNNDAAFLAGVTAGNPVEVEVEEVAGAPPGVEPTPVKSPDAVAKAEADEIDDILKGLQ
jgi:hypothetical protein